jgi:hypothetical protein
VAVFVYGNISKRLMLKLWYFSFFRKKKLKNYGKSAGIARIQKNEILQRFESVLLGRFSFDSFDFCQSTLLALFCI